MADSFSTKSVLAVIVDSMESDFVKQALASLQSEASLLRWSLEYIQVGTLGYAERKAMLERLLEEKKIAAAAYLHLTLTDDQAQIFLSRKIPLGYLAGELKGVHWVAADEAEGGAQVAARLIRLGHKHVAILSGPETAPECRQREEGFLSKWNREGVTFDPNLLVRSADFSTAQAKLAAGALLNAAKRPSAIFVCAGDLAAQGALLAARAAGLSVPQDLSLVGWDNLPFTETMDPPLCTVRQPLNSMALRLFRSLANAVEQPEAAMLAQRINPLLVLRKSCGPPALVPELELR